MRPRTAKHLCHNQKLPHIQSRETVYAAASSLCNNFLAPYFAFAYPTNVFPLFAVISSILFFVTEYLFPSSGSR